MSIFKVFLTNVMFALNKNKMKDLKEKQAKIVSQNNELLNLNSILQEQMKTMSNQNEHIVQILEKKDVHRQNQFAKKNGFKSAFQYKLNLKNETFKNNQKLISLKQQQNKYNRDLKQSQKELTKINNSISIYNNLQITTIMALLITLILSIMLIIRAIAPNIIFENVKKYLIYCFITGFIVFLLSLLMYLFDRYLYKKLELGNLHIYNYTFHLLLMMNILMTNTSFSSSIPYVLLSFYVLYGIFVFSLLIINKNEFSKNKNYCFSLDFTVFNSQFVIFTIITLINSVVIENDIMSLIIKIIYALGVLIYLLLFVWEAITSSKQCKKNFRHYLYLSISIILLIFFILCAILNFTLNMINAIEIMGGVGGTIIIFSPLYQGFKKTSLNDNIKSK